MIAYTIRDTFRLPLKKISDILGCNHTTIIYYLKMYDSEYKYNQEFRNFAIAMKGVSSDIRTEFQEELEEELNEIIG